MSTKSRIGLIMGACGAALSVASTSAAPIGNPAERPFVINIAGATLLENFVQAPASTNDYLDVDGDGTAAILGTGVEQLATGSLSNPYPANLWWVVQYRATGSIRGLQELIDFGRTFVTNQNGVDSPVPNPRPDLHSSLASKIFTNRQLLRDNTVSPAIQAIANLGNPGAWLVRSAGLPMGGIVGGFTNNTTATALVNPNNPADGGVRIDLAPVDVPTRWAVISGGGSADFSLLPGQPGYGDNPRVSVAKDGSTTGAGFTNKLASLTGGAVLFDPANPGAADDNTIFETQLFFAPIGTIVNFGTGIRELTYTDLRHLFVAGRMPTGENLMVVTRDSGSGTRAGYMNSICIDPSWGNGDNLGGLSNTNNQHQAGPNYQPSNKGGNSGVEASLINTRLGVGYIGVERGFTGSGSGSWLLDGEREVAAVRNDLAGSAVFARPTLAGFLSFGINNYVIGGPAIIAHFGDPRAEPVADGGDNNGFPQMPNQQAAAYLNNFTRSVAAFISTPADPINFGTPGEFSATQFILNGAKQNINDPIDPCNLIANPDYNPALANFISSDPNNILNINAARLASFGTVSLNGRVPVRQQLAATYSDQALVPAGDRYINQAGVQITYTSLLTARNRISGDFNGDGARDITDAVQMVSAWHSRNGGPVWLAPNGSGPIAGAPGSDAIIEVLGDYNNDGSFNDDDVRYWADGLGVDQVTRILDRKAAFTAVDNASLSVIGNVNFFGTTLATGAAYQAGDSRGDIIGLNGLNNTRGFAPGLADGAVNNLDIDYVYAQFKTNPAVTDGALNWSDLNEAVSGDLSADINGDLVIDQADVCELVTGILGTSFGDANLDGVVNATDIATVTANLGQPGGWAQGDFDGDGVVTANDLAIANGAADPCAPPCNCVRGQGDANGDCQVNGADLSVLLSQFGQAVAPGTGADFNNSGNVDGADLSVLLSNFGCQ